jgi:hypothetical protein
MNNINIVLENYGFTRVKLDELRSDDSYYYVTNLFKYYENHNCISLHNSNINCAYRRSYDDAFVNIKVRGFNCSNYCVNSCNLCIECKKEIQNNTNECHQTLREIDSDI